MAYCSFSCLAVWFKVACGPLFQFLSFRNSNSTNFVGTKKNDIQELSKFLDDQKVRNGISEFCTTQRIRWKFIPGRAPYFGGLWESTVKSVIYHLKRVVANVKLTFEEYSTVLAQEEASLNSWPLISLSCDGDGFGVLTPSHFLIERLIESLPDPSFSYHPVSLLCHWHLCQNLVWQFWQRWRQEYLRSLCKCTKWHKAVRNLYIGDVVVLHDYSNMVPTKWPLSKVIKTFSGDDDLVRVVEVKTSIWNLQKACQQSHNAPAQWELGTNETLVKIIVIIHTYSLMYDNFWYL